MEIHSVKDRPCVFCKAQSHSNWRVIKSAYKHIMVVECSQEYLIQDLVYSYKNLEYIYRKTPPKAIETFQISEWRKPTIWQKNRQVIWKHAVRRTWNVCGIQMLEKILGHDHNQRKWQQKEKECFLTYEISDGELLVWWHTSERCREMACFSTLWRKCIWLCIWRYFNCN